MLDKGARKSLQADDSRDYMKYTGPQQLAKALHTLEGLLEGAVADGVVTIEEVRPVREWLFAHQRFAKQHPFSEVIPLLNAVVADGKIDEAEAEDVRWLCQKYSQSNEWFDAITADMQRLQGLLGGIIADQRVSAEELEGLRIWMGERELLRGCWPYDEIESLIVAVLRDGRIDESEQRMLKVVFSQFADLGTQQAVDLPLNEMIGPIQGFCAVCPEVQFRGRTFCFTGKSQRATKEQMADLIVRLGGSFVPRIRTDLNYLVIGAGGNPAWAFACYGRKVEQAMKYRKQGHPVTLVHETDFWDAVVGEEGG